jgi:hypothetical protein
LNKNKAGCEARRREFDCNLVLFFLFFCFHRVAFVFPGFCSADESSRICDSVLSENLHRTGAGIFVRSGTVSDYLLIGGKLFVTVLNLVGSDIDRALNVFAVVSVGIACVNEKRFARVKRRLRFVERNTLRLLLNGLRRRSCRRRGLGFDSSSPLAAGSRWFGYSPRRCRLLKASLRTNLLNNALANLLGIDF